MKNADYYSILDQDGQFKGALRTVLPLGEIALVAEWKVITYQLNGRERKAIFNRDGCSVIPHLIADPTKGKGNWRGMGDHPIVEILW